MKSTEDMTDAEYYKMLDDEDAERDSVIISYMIDLDILIPALELVACVACSGSGRYDHNGSPKCGGCNGTGRTLKEHEETIHHILWQISDDDVRDEYKRRIQEIY